MRKDYYYRKIFHPSEKLRVYKTNNKGERFFYSAKQKYLIIGLLLFIFLNLIWFFFASPLWQIDSLSISLKQQGADISFISRQKIYQELNNYQQQKKALFFKRSNLFLFNTKTVEQQLNNLAFVKKIEIIKKYPHYLTIVLNEESPTAVLINSADQQYFWLNQDGGIIQSFSQENFSLIKQEDYFLIYNDLPISQLSMEDLKLINQFILQADSLIKQQTEQFKIISAEIKEAYGQKIYLRTNEQWLIYLNGQDNLLTQIESLFTFLQNKKEIDRSNWKYIDLRFGNKIYYR